MSDSAPLMGNDNERTGPDGMPMMDRAEKDASYNLAAKLLLGFPIVGGAIGFGLAYGLYAFASDKQAVSARVGTLAATSGQWALLSGYVFHRTVGFLNTYPVLYKGQVMRAKSSNLRANMLVYEQIGERALPGKVVLVENGDLGQYNRANRSLHHFVENSLPVVLSIVLNTPVFPAQAFGLTCLFALGRIAHQIGYSTKKGYGAHALGFMLATLSSEALAGLLLVAALKAFGVL